MTCTKLLFLFFSGGMVTCCEAQTMSSCTDTTKKANSSYPAHRFTFHPGLFYNHIYSFKRNPRADQYVAGKSGLKTNYTYQPFPSLDYQPFITKDNFGMLTRPDYMYHYDPTNPYNAKNPLDVLFSGGTDYLLWLLFEK